LHHLQTIVFYTKPNCSLCDEALEQIEAVRQLIPFRLEQVGILDDFALYEKYKHDIPVLCLNGLEIFRHRVNREELMKDTILDVLAGLLMVPGELQGEAAGALRNLTLDGMLEAWR